MSSGGANILDVAEVARGGVPAIPSVTALPNHPTEAEKRKSFIEESLSINAGEISEEDLQTLHRVAGKISWQAYTIAFVEFCERFSYYGTTVVCTFYLILLIGINLNNLLLGTNYIQQPRPAGSTTGANHGSSDFRSGGFGLGQRTAFAVTTFNSFWAYFSN